MTYGYVCFAYSKNEWIAKQIAMFTKSQWSHSFLTVPSLLGKDMAMEAAGNGVSMIPFDIAYRANVNQNYETYRFKIDQAAIDKGILKTIDLLETGYGYLHYPWFIWRSLNKLFGRDIKSQNNWLQNGTVCSDLVRLYITNAGRGDLFKDFGIDSANAQDIYDIVKANPDLFELVESKANDGLVVQHPTQKDQ